MSPADVDEIIEDKFSEWFKQNVCAHIHRLCPLPYFFP